MIAYTLPRLHTGKNWYVDFMCFDPISQSMRRKKYMLDGIKNKSQRYTRAAELITTITYKLQSGWNCWSETDDTRHYTTMKTAMDLYMRQLDKQHKTGSVREKTWLTYKTYFATFTQWMKECPLFITYVYQFDKRVIMDFLDYVFQDRDVSARTRNNYRGWLYTLAEWMIERDYITSNPVEGIKNLREDTKKRDPLTMHQLKELRAYLNKTGEQHFLLACMLEYYAFIRPNELCFLRIGDIKVSEQKIVVDGSWSKNRRDEAVGLNQKILRLMIKLGIFRYPSDYYLFGKKFFPSEEQADSRIFREKFMKIRDILGWKDSIQFYSLKDSGIRDLANAAGIVIARDQARHADITTTNRYLKGDASAVHEETKTFDGNL